MVPVSQTKEEEFFEHYMELPPELRMLIIDAMRPEDRCRFTRVSKLCQKEAISSKNYVYGVGININGKDDFEVFVEHRPFENQKFNTSTRRFEVSEVNKRRGFCVKIKRESNGQYFTKYCNYGDEDVELWKVEMKPFVGTNPSELEMSEKLYRLAMFLFKRFLTGSKHSIKKLYVKSAFDHSIDISEEISRLRRLEILDADHIDYRNIICHIRNPLKTLSVYGNAEVAEQIFECQQHVYMKGVKLTYDQFQQFSAETVHCTIGKITEKNVFHLISSWLNGKYKTIRFLSVKTKYARFVFFYLSGSEFDIGELLRFFGKEWDGQNANETLVRDRSEVTIMGSPHLLKLTFGSVFPTL